MPSRIESQKASSSRYKSFFMKSGGLAFLGLMISGYALVHHLDVKRNGHTDAACNVSNQINCDAAASSQFSEVLGVPLPVWGGGFFLGLIFISLLGLVINRNKAENLTSYCYLAYSGLLGSLALAAISAVYLGSLCPSCLLVYLVCTLQAILAYLHHGLATNLKSHQNLAKPLCIGLVPVLLGVVAYRSTPQDTPAPTKSLELNGTNALATNFMEIPLSTSAFSGLGEDYRIGSDDAKVKIFAFSDFQCPACKRMDSHLKNIRNEFGDQVLVVFKNYPLDHACNAGMPGPMHQFACRAAKIARCSGRQKKFWRYHDLVFSNQSSLSEAKLDLWALNLGLTREDINSCVKSKSIVEKIKDDIDLGNKLGVNSTPTVYVNGYKFVGSGLASLRAEVERILNNS